MEHCASPSKILTLVHSREVEDRFMNRKKGVIRPGWIQAELCVTNIKFTLIPRFHDQGVAQKQKAPLRGITRRSNINLDYHVFIC